MFGPWSGRADAEQRLVDALLELSSLCEGSLQPAILRYRVSLLDSLGANSKTIHPLQGNRDHFFPKVRISLDKFTTMRQWKLMGGRGSIVRCPFRSSTA